MPGPAVVVLLHPHSATTSPGSKGSLGQACVERGTLQGTGNEMDDVLAAAVAPYVPVVNPSQCSSALESC